MAEHAADAALRPLAPGPLTRIGSGRVEVTIAPQAGGRLAQVRCDGLDWLRSHDDGDTAAIAWGCYPMLPWAGRLRHGRFSFEGRQYQLPATLDGHAIHGVGYLLPWRTEALGPDSIDLVLDLPCDESWPFGGTARQRILVQESSLKLELSLQAGRQPMPRPVLGWHPWFRKPEPLDFLPTHHYLRDAAGIATTRQAAIPSGPWDDCFINQHPVVLHRAGHSLLLRSGCDHWVVYDAPADATCVEPQDGPPDAFNLRPGPGLAPGESTAAWCVLEWT